MKRFLFSYKIDGASGSQTWYVDAKNETEARVKLENNDGDIYETDCTLALVEDFELIGETNLSDFGDSLRLVVEPKKSEFCAAAEKAIKALDFILTLADDSSGVDGYHLNGDLAFWGEFTEQLNEVQFAKDALADVINPEKADCLNDAEHQLRFRRSHPSEYSRMCCADCGFERYATKQEIEENT